VRRLARLLRRLAELLDYEGTPRRAHWSFTYEQGRGAVFWQDGRGCPLYLREADYLKAYDEAAPMPDPADQWQRGHRHPYLKQEGTES
jgi:hypothetical protein